MAVPLVDKKRIRPTDEGFSDLNGDPLQPDAKRSPERFGPVRLCARTADPHPHTSLFSNPSTPAQRLENAVAAVLIPPRQRAFGLHPMLTLCLAGRLPILSGWRCNLSFFAKRMASVI